MRKVHVGVGLTFALLAALAAGCGGDTKTVTESAGLPPGRESFDPDQGEGSVSLGGSEEAGYPTLEQAGYAIVADIEERYGVEFESGECEDVAPELGGAPLYSCELKMGGEWHGNIQATMHPDLTLEWVDLSNSAEVFEGSELSVEE